MKTWGSWLFWLAAIASSCQISSTDDLKTEKLAVSVRLSECGGFDAPPDKSPQEDGDYCAAERLFWSYDAESDELLLRNTRVALNCCGIHEMEAISEQGGFAGVNQVVVHETDMPKDGNRCKCECVFDFEISIQKIATYAHSGQIHIIVDRDITDSGVGREPVLETDLVLSEKNGVIVISDDSAELACSTSM